MSSQKTISVYSFAELSAISQQRAISDYEDSNIHEDWDEPIIEAIKEAAYEIGILDFDVQYSGFSSQGDGLSFTGRLSELLVESIYKEKVNKDGLTKGQWMDVEFKRKSYPHYVHENMVYSIVDTSDDQMDHVDIIEEVFNDWKNELCIHWYDMLEAAYCKYFSRDNLILELAKYEFYEDGRCAGLSPKPSIPYAEYNIAS